MGKAGEDGKIKEKELYTKQKTAQVDDAMWPYNIWMQGCTHLLSRLLKRAYVYTF